MKAKVLKDYRDKYTKELVKSGSLVDVNEKRFKEINSTKHGILVEEVILGMDLSNGEDITSIDGEIIEKSREEIIEEEVKEEPKKEPKKEKSSKK